MEHAQSLPPHSLHHGPGNHNLAPLQVLQQMRSSGRQLHPSPLHHTGETPVGPRLATISEHLSCQAPQSGHTGSHLEAMHLMEQGAMHLPEGMLLYTGTSVPMVTHWTTRPRTAREPLQTTPISSQSRSSEAQAPPEAFTSAEQALAPYTDNALLLMYHAYMHWPCHIIPIISITIAAIPMYICTYVLLQSTDMQALQGACRTYQAHLGETHAKFACIQGHARIHAKEVALPSCMGALHFPCTLFPIPSEASHPSSNLHVPRQIHIHVRPDHSSYHTLHYQASNTSLRTEAWGHYLASHPDRQLATFLLQGIRHNFHISFSHARCSVTHKQASPARNM